MTEQKEYDSWLLYQWTPFYLLFFASTSSTLSTKLSNDQFHMDQLLYGVSVSSRGLALWVNCSQYIVYDDDQ